MTQRTTYDVVVLGGGPAGAAAALTLCRYSQWSVALVAHEGQDEKSWRLGPATQTLSPGVDPLLRFLGVSDAFASARHPRAFGMAAAWGSSVPRSRDFIFSPFGAGWHLDRPRFDRMLLGAVAESGGTVLGGTVLANRSMQFDRTTAAWTLSLGGGRAQSTRKTEALELFSIACRGRASARPFPGLKAGRYNGVENAISHAQTISARFVVDATGRRALVARRLGVKRLRVDRLVALSATLAHPSAMEGTTFVEASEHGWWYATPGANGLTVAFLSDADIVRTTSMTDPATWQRALASTTHLRERTSGLRIGPLRIHASDSSRLAKAAGDGWIAAGDAAAAHDPLSSSGVPRALSSGASAARAVDAYLRSNRSDALDAYADAQQHDFDAYNRMRSAYYAVERRWADAPFWSRRRAHD